MSIDAEVGYNNEGQHLVIYSGGLSISGLNLGSQG